MDVTLRRYPGVPGTAVKEGVPGVVGVPVGLGAFLPAGRHRDLDHWVLGLDVVHQFGVHVVGAGRGRIEAEHLVELADHRVRDSLFLLHREEPDGQFLGLEFVAEFLALEAKES